MIGDEGVAVVQARRGFVEMAQGAQDGDANRNFRLVERLQKHVRAALILDQLQDARDLARVAKRPGRHPRGNRRGGRNAGSERRQRFDDHASQGGVVQRA